VSTWEQIPEELSDEGPGPTTITVDRGGSRVVLDVELAESETNPGAGFLGVAPLREHITVGPVRGVGVAGQLVWEDISNTFRSLYTMFRPSSLAQYFGVLLGDTEIPPDIRPVSPIGIVSIGSQTTENAALFVGILASVNVILATINLLPLFPLDGGHFAVALYEKITGRQADIRKLAPVAAAVIGVFAFLGFVAIILDVRNPISL
jgi:membrane-associated protease RseP (regulator of RpoE activity)